MIPAPADLAERLEACHAAAVHDVLRAMGLTGFVLPPEIRCLDPARRRVQIKRLGQPRQKPGLRRPFGHAARQRFACIARRVFHQLGLFAPLRHRHLDLAPGAV